MQNRVQKSAKNVFWGLITYCITLILTFVNRTVFIQFLKVEYLGCNGLFGNILSMLSLAELGIGAAIVYSLYKPLAEDDIKSVQAYMNTYKNAYWLIAGIIAVVGLCLVPVLPYIVDQDMEIGYGELRIIYTLFLLNTVLSYFFAYKRSLLSAAQYEYINSLNNTVFAILRNLLQVVLLFFTRSYYVYLGVTIVCTLISNYVISRKCDQIFPYLKKNNEKLDKPRKKQLYKYVLAQSSHKVGGIVVSGTDNLLVTTMVTNGLYMVGLYSNYVMVISSIRGVISIIFSSLTGSIGNLNTENDIGKRKKVFDDIFFATHILYSFSAICIFCLIQDFITLWLGESYTLNLAIVLVVLLNYVIGGLRTPCQIYNTTLGLFWNDRFKPWIEAAINLIASIVLIKFFGMVGVFLGTLVSTLATSLWIEPYLLYKHGFKMKLIKYFAVYLKYCIQFVFVGLIAYYISKIIPCESWIMWIVKAILICGITIGLFAIFNIKSNELKDLWLRFKQLVRKRR